MENRMFFSLLLASVSGGVCYWILEFFGPILEAINNNLLPLDTILILLLVLIVSIGGGLLLGGPALLVLKRFQIISVVPVLLMAMFLAIIVSNLVLFGFNGDIGDFLTQAAAGLVGGIVFCLINGVKIKLQNK